LKGDGELNKFEMISGVPNPALLPKIEAAATADEVFEVIQDALGRLQSSLDRL